MLLRPKDIIAAETATDVSLGRVDLYLLLEVALGKLLFVLLFEAEVELFAATILMISRQLVIQENARLTHLGCRAGQLALKIGQLMGCVKFWSPLLEGYLWEPHRLRRCLQVHSLLGQILL